MSTLVPSSHTFRRCGRSSSTRTATVLPQYKGSSLARDRSSRTRRRWRAGGAGPSAAATLQKWCCCSGLPSEFNKYKERKTKDCTRNSENDLRAAVFLVSHDAFLMMGIGWETIECAPKYKNQCTTKMDNELRRGRNHGLHRANGPIARSISCSTASCNRTALTEVRRQTSTNLPLLDPADFDVSIRMVPNCSASIASRYSSSAEG